MPGPVSTTATAIAGRPSADWVSPSRTSASTPPPGMASRAFKVRFKKTCSSSGVLATATRGSSPSSSISRTPRASRLGLDQGQRPPRRVPQVHCRSPGGGGTPVGQEAPGDSRHALAEVHDPSEVGGDLVRHLRTPVGEEQARLRDDDRDGVVHLVGQAARQLSHRGELAGLQDGGFRALLGGDVLHHLREARWVATAVVEGGRGDEEGALAAAGRAASRRQCHLGLLRSAVRERPSRWRAVGAGPGADLPLFRAPRREPAAPLGVRPQAAQRAVQQTERRSRPLQGLFQQLTLGAGRLGRVHEGPLVRARVVGQPRHELRGEQQDHELEDGAGGHVGRVVGDVTRAIRKMATSPSGTATCGRRRRRRGSRPPRTSSRASRRSRLRSAAERYRASRSLCSDLSMIFPSLGGRSGFTRRGEGGLWLRIASNTRAGVDPVKARAPVAIW